MFALHDIRSLGANKTLRSILTVTGLAVMGGECLSQGTAPAIPIQAQANIRQPGIRAELLFLAMAAVESRFDQSAIGDGGRAIGVYQIHHSYWKDAGVPGKWKDCWNPAYARCVILAYWKRYCPSALETGNWEVLSRIHNGGPQGHTKRQTIRYWRKIQQESLANTPAPESLGIRATTED